MPSQMRFKDTIKSFLKDQHSCSWHGLFKNDAKAFEVKGTAEIQERRKIIACSTSTDMSFQALSYQICHSHFLANIGFEHTLKQTR